VAQEHEVNAVAVLGEANEPGLVRGEGANRIGGIGWIDDATLLVWGDDTRQRYVHSINLIDGDINWVNRYHGQYSSIALSPDGSRVLIESGLDVFDEEDPEAWVQILDAQTGEQQAEIEALHILRAARKDAESDVAVFAFGSSDDELLVVTKGSEDDGNAHGQHAYLYDWRRRRVEQRYFVDPGPYAVSVSEDGRLFGYVADQTILCIYDAQTRRDRVLAGEHVAGRPFNDMIALHAPFYSGIQITSDYAVVSRDRPDHMTGNSEVYIINLDNGEVEAHIETPGGHLEFDVDFEHERVAVTGSAAHLAIYDFAGNELYLEENITAHRNLAIAFSEDGQHIALGGYENTVSVFEIVEP